MHNKQNIPTLTTRSVSPENKESPIHFLHPFQPIPREFLFRRNHFTYPQFTLNNFLLPINGEVVSPITFQFQNLLTMPSKSIRMVLECSGNNRADFSPKVFGEQWTDGAVSEGVWKGVPLRDLLSRTGLKNTAKEILFMGYVEGIPPGLKKSIFYARSLPIKKALHEDIIVAYHYNGKPIPYKHGFPLRLVVPGWYGMASVKWLKSITVIDYFYNGHFQTNDYVYKFPQDENQTDIPVTNINVKSVIQQPLDQEIVKERQMEIKGLAWSGFGRIFKVEIKINDGNWQEVQLENPTQKYAWSRWKMNWNSAKGEYTIQVRATDSAGNTQPIQPIWNKKGYGYNAISKINVKVE